MLTLTSSSNFHSSFFEINKRFLYKRPTFKPNESLIRVNTRYPLINQSKDLKSATKTNLNIINFFPKQSACSSSSKVSLELKSSEQAYRPRKLNKNSRSKSTILYNGLKHLNKSKKKFSLPAVDNSENDSSDEISESFKQDFTNFSITDFCQKPTFSRFTSNLSNEAQHALIKSYEDMICDEILVSFPGFESLLTKAKSKIHTLVEELTEEQILVYKMRFKSKLEEEQTQGTDENLYKEYKFKMRFSHFIESAQKILDSIEALKRLFSRTSVEWIDEFNVEKEAEAKKRKISSIVAMFEKWMFLWNLEYR